MASCDGSKENPLPTLIQALSFIRRDTNNSISHFSLLPLKEPEKISEDSVQKEFKSLADSSGKIILDLSENISSISLQSLTVTKIEWSFSFFSIKLPYYFRLENVQFLINESNRLKKIKMELFLTPTKTEQNLKFFIEK